VFLFRNGVALPELESEVEAAIKRRVSECFANYMPPVPVSAIYTTALPFLSHADKEFSVP